MTAAPGSALVLPVGLYLGALHRTVGADAAHHTVRTGFRVHRLRPGAQLETWALAHGSGDPDTPWTVDALLSAAAAAGIPAEGELDELVGAGLVALVTPDTAPAFAAAHRVRPLLVGLGTPAGDTYEALGIPGLPHSARVRPRTAEVWRWAGLWPDLAQAADAWAGADREAGLEPGGLLELLADVQVLLGTSTAYLDLPGGGRPYRRHDLPPA